MRKRFIEELNKLNTDLINMGSMCEEATINVYRQIEKGFFDEVLYQRNDELEKQTDAQEKKIESACLKLIFSQQPVASDLRLISAISKMVNDLERIADQTFDILDLFKDFTNTTLIKGTKLKEMCQVVVTMVSDSVASFIKRDTDLAKEVLVRDSEVNAIFSSIKNDLTALIAIENMEDGESIVDILMIAKYLERIGDHSTNIAESVIYVVSGQ